MSKASNARPAGLRRRVTTNDGIALEVREFGDPDGPELLLIPGAAQSYLSFHRQFSAPELRHCRIVSYDPRGHGLSEKPSDGALYYQGRRWGDEVRAVIEGAGLRRPVVAGWSLGGRILRQYLVEHGDEQLSGVAIVSARPIEVPEVVGPGNQVVAGLDIEDEASRIETAIGFLRACFEKQPDPDEFAFQLGFNMLAPWEIRLEIGKWLTDPEVSTAALQAVRVPAIVFHGTADRLILPLAAEMAVEALAGAASGPKLSLFEGCGHSVFFEEHERFNRELAVFVNAAWRT